MLERLERSFEVQRRFTADASHELRSPLSRLRAELEVMLRRPRSAAEYEETLRSCLDEVQRVQGLIEELLELARIDARQEPESAEPMAVNEIVEAAVAAVRPEAERRRVAISVEPAPALLVNAAPGAAKVALANIAVSDRGPGIASEDTARLFERFYRGRASRSAEVPGFGLGLAISRALVERQGGRITVDAPGENGATFSLHLPRA